ncbi:MAG: nuclear transport factor 2 family protein [Chloroflexi bacterium]|nr:MAG: nuclear transport factor 2 family protein [Chloroflexota bacterium]
MTPEEFLKKYENALMAQQWQSVAPLFHEDVCVTFSDGTYKGKTAVQQAFERTFNLIKDETYTISNLCWIRKNADLAVCLFTYHWSGMINGQQASGSGRGTSVLVNENGRWLLLTEHLGPNPA